MLPKLKKKIKGFLLEEEGKISKASSLYLGAALAAASLADVHAQCLPGGGGCACACAGSCSGGGGGSCGCEEAGGGAYCLLNDSLVAIGKSKTKKIQDLEVGESVISFDIISNMVIRTKITKLIKNHVRHYFYLINNTLSITNDHPMLVMRNYSYEWVNVEDLLIGDKIKSLRGFTNIISIVKIMRSENTVYAETESGNFIVKGWDNYYVVKGNYIENEMLEENVLVS
ncbi:hypothetical protein HYW20_06585 [Candidatus Woesearchaeota archaeon]|nr:hypothetical protein [Candidatus Woesearchaeota archaeon]